MKYLRAVIRNSLFLGLGVLAGGEALAANTATGNATAKIVQPIAITADTDLTFGKIAAGASAGSVTVKPDGTFTSTGINVLSTSTPAPASFTVTGETDATYTVSLPSTINISNGAVTMPVNTFTSSVAGTGTLAGGTDTLYVGATLLISTNQAPGTYTGTFDVTVNYD